MDSELNEGEVTTTAERRATTGLVMCGGEGTRLRPAVGDTEKPLVEIDGRPMIDRVVAALQASSLTTVAAGVSPATPETAAHLTEIDGVDCIETAGDGYVADLNEAVGRLTTPVVTVVADLPLVAADHVDRAAATAGEESLTVCVPYRSQQPSASARRQPPNTTGQRSCQPGSTSSAARMVRQPSGRTAASRSTLTGREISTRLSGGWIGEIEQTGNAAKRSRLLRAQGFMWRTTNWLLWIQTRSTP